MIELFRVIMANPLRGIVAVLCVVAVATHIGLIDVRVTQASIKEQQVVDAKVNDLVYRMNDTLIRVDENLGHIKEHMKQNITRDNLAYTQTKE